MCIFFCQVFANDVDFLFSQALKSTLLLYPQCGIGHHPKFERKRVLQSNCAVCGDLLFEDKLTQCRASGPTDKPEHLQFASLPTGKGREHHWSGQLHWAPLWSLQNLVIIGTKQAFMGRFLNYFQRFENGLSLRCQY